MTDKVKITNMLNNRVNVSVPDIRFSRIWPGYGSVVQVEKETLEQLMYDVGFKNMVDMGILFIEDMEVKKELGIEPEDAEEPVNIIKLTNKEMQYYLTGLSFVGFKDKVKKLSMVQVEALCDYAIDNKIMSSDKCKLLKEICGRDIINAIRLKEQNEEA